jgi:outer membrane murein-binding lipoprotein Lpp
MSSKRTLGALALVTLLVAGCDTTPKSGPLATMPTGTNESLLRQQQLQNVQSDPSRAMQNPGVTAVNPGAGGIERATTGGTGSMGGQVGGMRSDGTVVRPGGAPSTQGTVPNNPRRPQPTTN